MTTTEQSVETDGRKTGLSTQGYPLRKIVDRSNRIHKLACGHKLPKPEPDSYDLRKSRRCVECGPAKPATAPLTVEQALKELRAMAGSEPQILIGIRDCGEETITLRETTLEYSAQIGMNGEDFDADSLPELMALVRQWHAEQGKES